MRITEHKSQFLLKPMVPVNRLWCSYMGGVAMPATGALKFPYFLKIIVLSFLILQATAIQEFLGQSIR